MLEKLRENASGWMLQSILWLLVLAFVGTIFLVWGYGDERGQRPVAKVKGQAITIAEFQQRYDRTLKQITQSNSEISQEMLKSLRLERKVIDELVLEKLQIEAAKEAGFDVSDDEISIMITTNPGFQSNGTFNRDLYFAVMKSNRLSPSQYENLLRNELLKGKLIKLISDAVEITEKEILDGYSWDYDQVNVRYSSFGHSRFESNVQVNDKDIEEYYNKNRVKFMTQEKRLIEYLFIDPAKAVESMSISDAEINEFYGNYKDNYKQKEQFHARHLIVMVPENPSRELEAELRAKAEGYLAEIRAGADFAKMAEKYSEGPSSIKGGDLGNFGPGDMDPVFEDAVRKLKPGEISDIVKTSFGFHVIKLESHKPESYTELKLVKDDIIEKIRRSKGSGMAKARINKALKAAGEKDADWKKVAEANDVKYSSIRVEVGKELNLGEDWNKLVKRAFRMNVGELSSVMEMSKGYFVIRLIEVIPPKMRELEEVKKEIEQIIRVERSHDLARKTAQTIKDRYKEGTEFALLAKELNITVNQTGLITRLNPGGGPLAKPEILRTAFAMNPGDIEIISEEDGQHLLVLLEKKPASKNDFSSKREEVKKNLITKKRFDIISAWRETLWKEAEASGDIKIEPQYL
ncbi:MAG: SurA N-terminal domain-containing protein [Nitrospinota bacterium]|nr:SurA N-terminal domain-containing protein [Nitrospinota bacterium]